MRYPILVLAVLLAGCTSLESQLAPLPGQSIDVAIQRLGIPTREYDIAGKKAYEWTASAANPFSSSAPVTSCQIRALVSNGVVQNIDWNGSNGACSTFIK